MLDRKKVAAILPGDRWTAPLALTAIWIGLMFLVNPIGDFPLNDDWAWGRAVKNLLDLHAIKIPGWAGMTLVAQVIWGGLFCIFGFSFTALRFSTLVLGLVQMLGAYALAREVGAERRLAFFVALAVALEPYSFHLSYSFMNDVPFSTVLVLGMLAAARALRTRSRAALAAVLLLPLVATLTRQLGLMIPIMFFVGLLAGRTIGWRILGVVALSGLLAWGGLRLYEAWMRAHGGLGENYGVQAKAVMSVLTKPGLLWDATVRLPPMVITLGLFSLPALVLTIPRQLRGRRWQLAVAALAALAAGYQLLEWRERTRATLPLMEGLLFNFGTGPITLTDVYFLRLPHLARIDSPAFWGWLTTAGIVGAAGIAFLFVLAALRMLDRDEERVGRTIAAMALAWLCGYTLVLLPERIFDRYLVPMFPMVALLGLWRCTPLPRWLDRAVWTLAVALLLFQAAFSVGATHDYLALNRTRWVALHILTDDMRVSPDEIDGGFEFNGWYRYPAPRVPKKPWWWVKDDLYLAALGPVRDFKTFGIFTYWRMLPPHEGRFFLLNR